MSKLAIAYAMKKKNKKMADGGEVDGPMSAINAMMSKMKPKTNTPAPDSQDDKYEKIRQANSQKMSGSQSSGSYAGGGQVNLPQGSPMDSMKAMASGFGPKKAHGGFIEEEKASGFVKHAGNDVKHNGPAISEEAKKLNQLKAIIMDSEEVPTVDGIMQKENEDYSGLDRYADGGMAGASYVDDEQGLVDRIMHKREKGLAGLDRYSQGGKVANDVGTGQEADKNPNQFDDLVLDDDLYSTYGDDAGDDLGNDQEDEDRKDIVSRIMASRKKKDKNPRPA